MPSSPVVSRNGLCMTAKRSWTIFAIAASMSGLLLAPMAGASAAPGNRIDDQLNSAQQQLGQTGAQKNAVGSELAEANAEVQAAEAALNQANAALPGAQAELVQAQSAAASATAADAAAAANLAAAEAQVAATQAEIDQVRAQIENLKGAIANFARNVYTSGGDTNELTILLTASSPAELTERYEAIKTVSRGKNRAVDEFVALQQRLDALMVQLQQQEAEARSQREAAAAALSSAQAAQARADAAKAAVDSLIAQRSGALAASEASRAKVAEEYAALEAAQASIQSQIRSLEAQKAAEIAAAERQRAADAARQSGSAGGGSSGGSGGGAPAGSEGFVWPLPGYSAGGGVGPRVHPVYGYRSCHTGVDMGAPSGTPIRSAAAGVVVAVNSGGPYGNHVIISHGGGLSSMYAHMSRAGVRAGQSVSAGEVIGYVGSTGYSTGPHLHFEIHVNGQPYNPLGWFGGSRYAVSC